MTRPLTIFMPHCSDLLTDHQPHGDGLVANGFVRRLAARGHRLIVAAPEVSLLYPLPSNVSLHVIGRTGGRGLLARLIYMLRIRRLYAKLSREMKFDVIHQLNPVYTGISLALFNAVPPVLLGPYVARWPDDPDAISLTGSPLRKAFGKLHAFLADKQQHLASSLLLTTEAARDRLDRNNDINSKVRFLPHGLDTEFFSPSSGTELPTEGHRKNILFLSNVQRRKGIFELLMAFEKLAARHTDTTLCIAGAGDDLASAKELASHLSATNQIEFLGRQSREQAVELLRNCTIFCLPSHGEPYGMAAAEAMSCGKPVVVTSAGGLGFLVEENAGFRVPPKNVNALTEALLTLLDSPALCRSMGAAGRELMLNTVAWDRVIDRLEMCYHEAIGDGAINRHIISKEIPTSIQNCA